MVIYGVALLAICTIVGLSIGKLMGMALGIDADLGGVGTAMLLLILLSDVFKDRLRLEAASKQGILFWSSIYIPVVVAMAATQDVVAAVRGGPVAILAGVLGVAACFALVPVVSNFGREKPSPPCPNGQCSETPREVEVDA